MKRLSLLAAIFLVILVGLVGVSSAADNAMQTVITQVQNIQMAVHALPATVNTGVQGKPTMYYLTSSLVSGTYATFACWTGFHMASIFEILDGSNLQYSTGLPDALSDLVHLDQGDGPPTLDFGWVRTGYDSTANPGTTQVPASVNCNNGTTRTDNDWGTVARRYDKATDSQMYSEWVGVSARQCNQSYHVWCVENK
jgi:hypothetical protein